MGRIVSCSAFTQFLVNQEPVFDKYIIKDIRPEDSWLAHVTGGTWEAWSGTQHTRDRFNAVFPNTTKVWTPTTAVGCLGTPCDKNEHQIGWGSTRITEFLEEQSWQTPLLCFDQMMHVTHAKEQFAYIISDILRPVVNWVQGSFIRKRGAQYVDNKFVANRNFGASASNFVFQWVTVGDEERYIDTNTPPTSVFKLTPQMLQRMVEPLMRLGYLGKNPFKDKTPPMLELVTDTQTTWELDRLGGATGFGSAPGSPTVSGNWRFLEWEAANKYWAYGFNGQIGNYAVRTDPFGLRFNYVGIVNGLYRYQVVLPYKNIASSGAGSQPGLKSVNNPDFDSAQFAFSYIWHARIMQLLTAQSEQVNPEMPFARRNWAGKWQFVMDNLGADVNGCVIENKRRNKGQFINDFKQAIAPDHTEFGVLIFHKREPSCIYEINTCNDNPGYPAQDYNSAPSACADDHSGTSPNPVNTVNTFTPVKESATGTYEVPANSATCEGGPLSHAAITGSTTLAALVVQLNQYLGFAGTWAVASGTTITLTGSCVSFGLPFAQ